METGGGFRDKDAPLPHQELHTLSQTNLAPYFLLCLPGSPQQCRALSVLRCSTVNPNAIRLHILEHVCVPAITYESLSCSSHSFSLMKKLKLSLSLSAGQRWPCLSLYLHPVVPGMPPKGHTKRKLSPSAGLDPPWPARLILCKLQWQSEYSQLTIDTAKLISCPPRPRPPLRRVFTGLLTAATEMPTCISHH